MRSAQIVWREKPLPPLLTFAAGIGSIWDEGVWRYRGGGRGERGIVPAPSSDVTIVKNSWMANLHISFAV